MGIYYYAVDQYAKKYFSPPKDFANKNPGIFHPENPFPGMVVMMNIRGYHFNIWNDCANDIPPDSDYEDVTEIVYKEYLEMFKD